MILSAELTSVLRGTSRLVALTGAGVSQESGLRTFRDAQNGLWAQYKPEELASPEAFRRDPKLVWDWYAWRREAVKGVRPNPGHYALAEKMCLNCMAIFNVCAAQIVIGLQNPGMTILNRYQDVRSVMAY